MYPPTTLRYITSYSIMSSILLPTYNPSKSQDYFEAIHGILSQLREFPGSPVVRTLLSLLWAQVQSLIRDLRFHKLCCLAKKRNKLERQHSINVTFKVIIVCYLSKNIHYFPSLKFRCII